MIEYQICWDWGSLFLYLFLSFLAWFCILQAQKDRKENQPVKLLNRYYVFWFIVWVFIAVFRKVDAGGVGGKDAFSYKDYFEYCLDVVQTNNFSYRAEVTYRLFNKGLRYLTANYHWLFFIVYGLITFSFIYFVNENINKYINAIPLIIIFYSYLVFFNVMRNGFAIGFCLIATVQLERNNDKRAIVFFVLATLMHTASVVYAGFYVFYKIYRKKGSINIRKVALYVFLFTGFGLVLRNLILSDRLSFGSLGTPLKFYFSRSIESGFFEDYWKIVVTQLIMAIAFIVFDKQINEYINAISDMQDQQRLIYIRLMCIYDLIMVPLCYLAHDFRAVHYFFIPRLLMWGILLNVVKKYFTKNSWVFLYECSGVVFIAYMIFRIYNNYEMSGLMPWVLDLF